MRRSTAIIIFMLTVGIRLIVELSTGYTVDDAFITFRYAENLAGGLGFAYNQGQAVLGTSTPLFTLLVAALNLVGVGAPVGALLLCLPAAGLTAVILYRWACKLGMEQLSVLPALVYAFFPRSIAADISGMETALFTALLVLAFCKSYRHEWLTALTAASLAAITRPEGVAALVVVAGLAVSARRGRRLLNLTPILLIFGNWLLFSFLHFGSVIPNSVAAKAALYDTHWNLGFLGGLSYLLGLHSPLGWLLLVLLLAGTLVVLHSNRQLAIVGLFAVSYLAVLAAADTHLFLWYPAPIYPLVFLMATVAVMWIIKRAHINRANRLNWAAVALSAPVILGGLWQLRGKVDYLTGEMGCYENIHRRAGLYLAEHAGKLDKVLAEDIGQLGYLYRGDIIDRDGLVTPAAIPYNKSGDYRVFADSVDADWLFIARDLPTSTPILDDSALMSRYRLVQEFGCEGGGKYALYGKRQ